MDFFWLVNRHHHTITLVWVKDLKTYLISCPQPPFMYIVLKNTAWNVDSDKLKCYMGLNKILFEKRGKENGKLLGAIGEIGNDVLYQSCPHLQETHFSSGDYRLNFQRESWKVCAETLLRSNRIYACTSHSLLWKSGLTSRNAKLC